MDFQPRIGVALWMAQDYGKRILTGVLEYVSSHNLPEAELLDVGTLGPNPSRLGRADGLVAVLRPGEPSLDALPSVPRVLVPSLYDPGDPCCVGPDGRVAGELAANHLLSLGLRQVSMIRQVAGRSVQGLQEMETAFARAAIAGGAEFLPPLIKDEDEVPMGPWVKALPTPCGVFCVSDGLAQGLVRCAKMVGRRVPDQIAVLGMGDDYVRMMVSHPTVSGLTWPVERIGWLAAEVLHRRLCGEKSDSVRVLPTGVTPRQSTEVLLVDDEVVAGALRFLRLHIKNPITPADVARAVGVSRSVLYERFRQARGHGIVEELNRCRMAHVERLLADTEMPVKSVAASVGILHLSSFNRLVKKRTGRSPRDYRKHVRLQRNETESPVAS